MPEKCIKDHVASADVSVAHQPPNQTKLIKMKSMILVALAFVAVVAAAPAVEEPIPIVRSEYNQQPEGGYQFGFESGNGVVREETGEVKEVLDEENKPQKVVVVRGSYGYPGEDGTPINIVYYADETGFHAEGDSIPKVASR